MTFSTNSDIDMDEVDAARRGRLAFFKGEGRVRLGLRQVALNICEVVFFGSKTPHLSPLPFCKGRSDKNARVWASVAPASTRSSLKFRCKNCRSPKIEPHVIPRGVILSEAKNL